MKIQELAIIFVIIILPISLIISAYAQFQIQTLSTQTLYDSKLTSATYDAMKAFQINEAYSSTSDIANSKIRDLEASITTFRNSIMSTFELNGYTEDELNSYIPALVYTLYDGFYIYSPYTNTNYRYDDDGNPMDDNGENLYGLKPYISYSCRYINGNIDVVITYALDNCVTVRGMINGEYVNKSGYLIDGITYDEDSGEVTYNGLTIESEQLSEYLPVSVNGVSSEAYPYVKINGTKYYRIGDTIKSVFNGELINQSKNGEKIYQIYSQLIDDNDAAKKYYKNAYEFTEWFKDKGLTSLEYKDAYDEVIDNEGNVSRTQIWEGDTRKIFQFNSSSYNANKNIENELSSFNQHRLAVIRYKIETNLAIAISNYNMFSGVQNVFQMPELKEDEWDYIIHNISIISFLQGLPIGGKIYNGYTIITDSESKDVVLEQNIYILGDDGNYHRIGDKDLEDGSIDVNSDPYIFTTANSASDQTARSAGRLNLDFKRKVVNNGTSSYYYYPLKNYNASYNSIVMQNNVTTYDDIYAYVNNQHSNDVKLAFYTALGRERMSQYSDLNSNSDYAGIGNNSYLTINLMRNHDNNDNEIFTFTNLAISGEKYGTFLNNKPLRGGYKFIGWFTEREGGTQITSNDTCNTDIAVGDVITLYAHWEKINYTLIFQANGGTVTTTSLQYGQKYGEMSGGTGLPTVEITGKIFIGWQDPFQSGETLSNNKYFEPPGANASVTIIAKFEDINYNITYNANGGSGTIPSTTAKYGDSIVLASSGSLTRTGYTFIGWSDGTNTYSAGASYTVTGDVEFKALWQINTYTVTYNANGGSVSPTSQTVDYNTTITLPTPTRTGYTFNGWSDGTNTYSAGASYTVTGNVTLTGQWSVNSYYLDIKGLLDGTSSGSLGAYGTCDVYINGTLVANDVKDYYAKHPYGSTYVIKDIKATSGHTYVGVSSGSLTGTIGTSGATVVLSFKTKTISVNMVDKWTTSGETILWSTDMGRTTSISQTINSKSGHIYYCGFNVGSYGDSDWGSSWTTGTLGFPKPTASYWEGYFLNGKYHQNVTKSWLYTATATQSNTIKFEVYEGHKAITGGSGGSGYAKVYYCDIYDLTEAFGAGNEPSLEWCNSYLKNTSSWSGTYTP